MSDGSLSGSLDSERRGKKDPSGYRDHCFLDPHWKFQKSSGLFVKTKGKNLPSFKEIFKKEIFTTERFTNQKSR